MAQGRALLLGVGAAVVIALVSGCAPTPDPSAEAEAQHTASAEATPPPSRLEATDQTVPEPGRTIEVVPPAETPRLDGHLLAVITPGDSNASADLLRAAETVAAAAGAELRAFPADAAASDPVGAALSAAIDADPDLIVGLGAGTVDVIGFESAQRLDQQFLVVGAQLPEPTENVTAVVWDGATSRGSAASPDGELDAASITAERGQDALEAGLVSIREGTTGVVLHLG